LIERFGLDRVNSIAKHRALPSKHVGDERCRLVRAEEGESVLVQPDCVVRGVPQPGGARQFR